MTNQTHGWERFFQTALNICNEDVNHLMKTVHIETNESLTNKWMISQ